MSYCFLPEAEAEYLEAVRFYEEQRAGLGNAIICEFERVIELVIEKTGNLAVSPSIRNQVYRVVTLPIYPFLPCAS